MSRFSRCKDAVRKWGLGPAKFLLRSVLPSVVPGSGVVVEVAERVLSLAAEAGSSEGDAAEVASGPELDAIGKILDHFEDKLADLAEQLLERKDESPEKLARLVVQEVKKDPAVEAALRDIAGTVARFDRLEAQNRELLRATHQGIDLQEVGLAVARRQETLVLDLIREQREANVKLGQLTDTVARLMTVAQDLTSRPAEALPKLRQLEAEQPRSAAVREAVAVGATFAFDLDLAASSLERAVELRPDDKPLAELCRQVTIKTRGIGGDSSRKPTPVPMSSGPEFRPGDTLDGWRLLTLLGRGGYGQVFKAERNGQVRALKVLLSHLITDPHFEATFKREILTLCNLGLHPHVVHFDEFGFDKPSGSWYFTMEYIEGESLQTRLLRGPIPAAEAVKVFTQLAGPGGLATVHEKGIVHRDIKPANILITTDGTPKLVDFGVAVATQREEKTKTGGHTVMFASPEQLRGFPAEKASDVFSLVGSLWYAVTKQEPGLFRPRDFSAELEPLRKLVLGGLQAWADERHPDAAAVHALLAEIDPASLTQKTVVATPAILTKPQRMRMPDFPPGRELVTTATQFATRADHSGGVHGLAFSSDGKLLIVVSDTLAELVTLPDCELKDSFSGDDCGTCVSISPDGSLLAIGQRNGKVELWAGGDRKHITTITTVIRGRFGPVESVAFNSNGTLLATASDSQTKLWSVPDGKLLALFNGHAGPVRAVAFSPDGSLLATASDDSTAKLWSVPDGKLLNTLTDYAGPVRAVAFSPDGTFLATASDDRTVTVLWVVMARSLERDAATVFSDEHGAAVRGIAFSPDGRLLATASDDRTVKLWSNMSSDWRRRTNPHGTGDFVTSLFDWKLRATLHGHEGSVTAVSFSPDGRFLATGGTDERAQVWVLHAESEHPNFSPSEPRYSPRPRLHLSQSQEGISFFGDQIWLQVGVENVGQGELVQLWAEVKSEIPALNGLTATFGRIDPGQRLDRCLAAVLPPDTKPGEITAELVFHEANGCAPPTQELTWTVHPLPRPDFPTTAHLEAEIPGRPPERRTVCHRKEIIDVVVFVTNLTGDDLPDMELILSAVKVPQGVRITGNRWQLGTLNDDTSAEGRLSFTVDADAHLGPATFEVRAVSGDGRTFAILPVATAVE